MIRLRRLPFVLLIASASLFAFAACDDSDDPDDSSIQNTVEGGATQAAGTVSGSGDDDDRTVPTAAAGGGGGSAPTATRPAQPAPSGDAITAEEAGRIATDRYGGQIEEIDRDDLDGRPVWEVEIDNSNEGDIEVKVDRQTGEILKVDHDD